MSEQICGTYSIWLKDQSNREKGLPTANFHLSPENYPCGRCDGSKECATRIRCASFYAVNKSESDRKMAVNAAEGERK